MADEVAGEEEVGGMVQVMDMVMVMVMDIHLGGGYIDLITLRFYGK